MAQVSVIIAIYKAENYIHKCLDSFLCQTLKDFELILVDDGSPDKSGEICDEYAKKDSRIKVFHKRNEGVALTREFGISKATGEYTIHADPDDWVEKDMLQSLYEKAKEDDADMVFCDYFLNVDGKETYMKETPTPNSTIAKDILLFNIERSLCTKLIRLSCYKKYDVHFAEGFNHGEDFLVSMQFCKHKELKISYLPKAFYHYIKITNANSITKTREQSYNKDSFAYDCRFLQELSKHIDNKDDYDYQDAVNIFRAFSYKVFSSKEFKERFYQNKGIFIRNLGLIKGSLLLISAYGFNWISYPMYKIITKIKSFAHAIR